MSNIYTDPPQSRNEAIIKSTIDGTQYTDPPQSRMEDLLLELKETIEQGGGGTTVVANPEGEATDELEKLQVGSDIYGIPKDYEDLDNKPSINSVELSGNKTASELGLQAELDGTQTVSGNPITVADAESMNAESVVVELEPKQDLHGYDTPWVGGAGKNKLPMTVATIKTINGDASSWTGNTIRIQNVDVTIYEDDAGNCTGILLNGTPQGQFVFTLYDRAVYTSELKLNGCPSGGSEGTYLLQMYNVTDQTYTNMPMDFGTGADFTPDSSKEYRTVIVVRSNQRVNNLMFKPMLRLATETDPTFAPYSNICPISGYSEVNVERVGKNLFDESNTSWFQGYIKGNDGIFTSGQTAYMCMKAFLPCVHLRGKKLTLNKCPGGYAPGFAFYSEQIEESFISGVINGNVEANTPMTVTVPENANYMRFTVPNQDVVYGIQLEIGETATTYEPYQGDTYTIDLDGTKYGGTLDVTEGKFIDDHGYATINYASLVDGLFRVQSPNDVNWSYPSCKCSCLEVWDTVDDLADNYGISYDDGYFYMNLPPECGATESAVQTWLQNNPIGVVYVTSDVTEESTTPTDIPLLENTNNISTDGTNITLKYQPNNVIGECKAYTDRECAKVLPPLPTTDGTYHLSCEVTSGVGVLSWVSDS